MTLKQFEKWCNVRCCDGCWGFDEAKFCVDLLDYMNRIPWWRRNKTWKKIEHRVVFAIVTPINKKIQEVMSAKMDGGAEE